VHHFQRGRQLNRHRHHELKSTYQHTKGTLPGYRSTSREHTVSGRGRPVTWAHRLYRPGGPDDQRGWLPLALGSAFQSKITYIPFTCRCTSQERGRRLQQSRHVLLRAGAARAEWPSRLVRSFKTHRDSKPRAGTSSFDVSFPETATSATASQSTQQHSP
jgi:hypothetical protein